MYFYYVHDNIESKFIRYNIDEAFDRSVLICIPIKISIRLIITIVIQNDLPKSNIKSRIQFEKRKHDLIHLIIIFLTKSSVKYVSCAT